MHGFTLMEVLVALFIFAILGVLSAMGLSRGIHGYVHVSQTQKALQEMMLTMTFLRRDITQAVQRPVRDTSGDLLPALMILSRTTIEFTRSGNTNPFQQLKRSTLLRVRYAFENHQLVRYRWRVLDRPPYSVPVRRVLLKGILDFQIQFVDKNGLTYSAWVSDGSQKTATHIDALFPKAIVVTVVFRRYGTLTGVFPLIGRGFYNA